jgi:hypothetical protein
MPDSDRRRERAGLQTGGDFGAGEPRVLILLVIGTIAEPVLEIDPESPRPARGSVCRRGADRSVQRGRIEIESRGQRRRVRRVLPQRAQRDGAELSARASALNRCAPP